MSASLVGSEMCIRDRPPAHADGRAAGGSSPTDATRTTPGSGGSRSPPSAPMCRARNRRAANVK
eukprot:8164263-Alexandrium_andersonii.AAC.1